MLGLGFFQISYSIYSRMAEQLGHTTEAGAIFVQPGYSMYDVVGMPADLAVKGA